MVAATRISNASDGDVGGRPCALGPGTAADGLEHSDEVDSCSSENATYEWCVRVSDAI